MVDFGGLTEYIDCARLHGMFGFKRIADMHPGAICRQYWKLRGHAQQVAKAARLVERVQDDVIARGRRSFDDLVIQTQWYAKFLASRQLMAEAFLARKTGDVDAMVDKLERLAALDSDLLDLALAKPNISDDFEMEGMVRAVRMGDGCLGEIAEIKALLEPEALATLRRKIHLHADPDAFAVRGETGTEVAVGFAIPEDLGGLASAILRFTARDLDGEVDGQEGVLRYADREIPLPPTGDGRRRDFEFQLPVELISGDALPVRFVLAGRPFGTTGYEVSNLHVVLTRE